MPDHYRNFAELTRHEAEGHDFRVRTRLSSSPVLVMAPHGGNIEPYTAAIADAIAGTDFGFYAFEGLKATDRWFLHITSENFDERRAMDAVSKAGIVLTVHGCKDTARKFVCAGGRHHVLRSQISAALREAGIKLLDIPGMMGMSPMNICNRGRSGQGVQLEISYGLRRHMMENPEDGKPFVEAVRGVLRRAVASGSILEPEIRTAKREG